MVVFVLAGAASANGCSSDGGVKQDAGDAALTDTKPPPVDTGVDAMCGAVACEVCDVSGYHTTAMTKPSDHPGVCSPTQVAAFVTACGLTETSTSCDDWQAAEAASDAGTGCLDCMLSDNTASAWGVYVCDAVSCSLNTPGCLDLALGQVSQEKSSGGAGSCGDLFSDSYGCQDYACGSCVNTDYDTCTTNAIANECSSYDALIQSNTGPCAALDSDAGAFDPNVCYFTTDSDLSAMATALCGGP